MKQKRRLPYDYVKKSDVALMAAEARIKVRNPTWVGRRRFLVPRLGQVHSCTWALCHFHRADFGHEVLGAVKPIVECRHGLAVRIPIDAAHRLYELSQREDR